MNEFLQMLSFEQKAGPTIEKVIRDADSMYCHARYVIVLDECGAVTERINRSVGYLANYLVVIAPVLYKNKLIYSIVMEIGISNCVPYQRVRWTFSGDDVRYGILPRKLIAQLTNKKIIELLPIVSFALQGIVDVGVSHRKRLMWVKTGKDKREMPIGIFITIPNNLSPLAYVCLEKDFTTRVEGHLSIVVQLIKDELNTLKFGYYPDKQLKRFKVVQNLAVVLSEARYSKLFLEVIRRSLGKETTKVRALFEQVIDLYKIQMSPMSEMDQLYFKLKDEWQNSRSSLVESFPISVQTHPKRDRNRMLRAKNCIRVEIHPSEEAIRAKHPVPGRFL